MSKQVAYILGPDGPFSELPTYEHRPEQIRYAQMVEDCIGQQNAQGHPLCIEGPTGTGKSLGYLIPAIADVLDRPHKQPSVSDDPWDDDREVPDWMYRRRVLVVTGNIALQEQLVEKDLPFIRKTTGWKFDWVLLKGRSNYGCHKSVDALDESQEGLFEKDLEAETKRLKEWFANSRSGDKSEVNPAPSGLAWSMVTSTSDDCNGKKCEFFDVCHYYRQRQRAREVEVIVTNYHFLFTEIALRIEMGAPCVLMPEFDTVVFDEAHDMGEIARRYFAEEIKTTQIRHMGRLLNGSKIGLKAVAKECWNMVREMSDWAEPQLQVAPNYTPDMPMWQERKNKIIALCTKVIEACRKRVNRYMAENGIAGAASSEMNDFHRKNVEAIQRPSEMATKYLGVLAHIFPETDEVDREGTVYYAERQGYEDKAKYAYIACPFHAGEVLKEALWGSCERAILTSATLADNLAAKDGETMFGFVRKELGLLDVPVHELVVDSPFDTEANMGVYIEDGADPSTRNSQELAERVLELIRASGGGALVLFTSYAAMNAVHGLISGELEASGIICYKQGDYARTFVTQKFRENVDSCLFATRSFFQGVDVQGDACRLVIIDKLPFPGMNDPFILHLKNNNIGGRWGWFMSNSVPRAMMLYRQAIGRLIRTKSDRGVVAVLDSRIAVGGKGYGAKFRAAIPSSRYFTDGNAVASFFGERPPVTTTHHQEGGVAAHVPPPSPPLPHTYEADDIPF